jgi:hypothetical protein
MVVDLKIAKGYEPPSPALFYSELITLKYTLMTNNTNTDPTLVYYTDTFLAMALYIFNQST